MRTKESPIDHRAADAEMKAGIAMAEDWFKLAKQGKTQSEIGEQFRMLGYAATHILCQIGNHLTEGDLRHLDN